MCFDSTQGRSGPRDATRAEALLDALDNAVLESAVSVSLVCASRSSLRPEFLEKSVAPLPTIAARPLASRRVVSRWR
jgi:hypothetical protein